MNTEILAYLNGFYVYHGSTQRSLKQLTPYKPRDVGSDPKNKETAVYATEDICVAIVFSLTSGYHGVWRLTHSDKGVTMTYFPKFFADQLRSNTGSLYILKKSDFSVIENWQYKSFIPVVPVAEIEVRIQDYIDLGGKINFKDDNSDRYPRSFFSNANGALLTKRGLNNATL